MGAPVQHAGQEAAAKPQEAAPSWELAPCWRLDVRLEERSLASTKVGEYFAPGLESDRIMLGSCLREDLPSYGPGGKTCKTAADKMARSIRNQDHVVLGFAGCCEFMKAKVVQRQFGKFPGCKNLKTWQMQAIAHRKPPETLTSLQKAHRAVKRASRDPIKRALFGAVGGLLGCWVLICCASGCAYYTREAKEGQSEAGDPEDSKMKVDKVKGTRLPTTELPAQTIGKLDAIPEPPGPECFEIGEDEDDDIELTDDAFFGKSGTPPAQPPARGKANLDSVALE